MVTPQWTQLLRLAGALANHCMILYILYIARYYTYIILVHLYSIYTFLHYNNILLVATLPMQMAAEASEIVDSHQHYFYQLLFNNVAVYKDTIPCDKKEQDKLMKSQAEKNAKDFEEGYKYLLYTSSNFCTYCLTTRNWLRSSDAVATRNFMVTELPIEEMLDVSLVSRGEGVDYLKHEEVNELFDPEVMSSCKVSQFMQQLDNKVDEILRAIGNQNLQNSVGCALDIKTMMRTPMMSSRELNYELPYNDWLFELVKRKLSPLNFCVVTKNPDEPVAAANEYIFSKSDLLIYHPAKCSKHVQALHVAIAKGGGILVRDHTAFL